MKICVMNGSELFNGDVLELISELKDNPEFVELWNEAELNFDDPTLDLEACCVIEVLKYRLEFDKALNRQDITEFLISFLG